MNKLVTNINELIILKKLIDMDAIGNYLSSGQYLEKQSYLTFRTLKMFFFFFLCG